MTPTIALVVVGDGRTTYLDQCMDSMEGRICGNVIERWMFDDSADDAYRATLRRRWRYFLHVGHGERIGFAGAVRRVWETLTKDSCADLVFHVEEDFVFTRPVNLDHMAEVLCARPRLVQMALRRQSWNTAERAAGGVVETHPSAYADRRDRHGREWLEHRMFFTTNPSLYRRSLCGVGWPDGAASEGRLTGRLLAQGSPESAPERLTFGYWGRRDSGAWVEHVGHERTGVGY